MHLPLNSYGGLVRRFARPTWQNGRFRPPLPAACQPPRGSSAAARPGTQPANLSAPPSNSSAPGDVLEFSHGRTRVRRRAYCAPPPRRWPGHGCRPVPQGAKKGLRRSVKRAAKTFGAGGGKYAKKPIETSCAFCPQTAA